MQHHGASFSCRGTKNDVVARNTMPWQVVQHCGTKNMVTARRALPRHDTQCCCTKTIAAERNAMPRHEEYGHGTNTKHQRSQVDCFLISVFGFFSPKPFWSAVEGFRMSQFTCDCDTFSTCDRQRRKYFLKPLLHGFYFA